MVPGIILAAGQSLRMGQAKALLPFGDTGMSFVHHLVAALCDGGVEEALVVGRPNDDALASELSQVPQPSRLVTNPDPERGQLSSLLAGLSVADRPGVTGVLVTPVDVPFVTAAVVRAVLAQFRATRAPIVRAVHAGRHGHPVIFARAMFGELGRADPSRGARLVLQAHAARVLNVEVSESVAEDVDTAGDYERLFHKVLAAPSSGSGRV